MSYLHPDGSPDTEIELLESARCFCAVVARLLEPNEGMIVELDYQEKYPEEQVGKYLVWRDAAHAQIKISKIDEDEPEFNEPHGTLVWMHDEFESTEIAKYLH